MNAILFLAATIASTNATVPTIVVEASRLGQTTLEMANHVEVMDAKAIAATDAKSLPELASHFPGIGIYHLGAGNPAMAQIQMRGYGENGFGRVLTVVDGESLNNPDMYAPNYSQISIGGIKSMEILYGPQTVLHGDSASAGMINIITDSFEDKNYAEVHGGSWGTIGLAAGSHGNAEDCGIGYYADMGYDHSDGYREHSKYDIWNAKSGIRKSFDNGSYLKLTTFFNNSAYDLPGPLSRDDAKNNPTKSLYGDWGQITAYGINVSGKGIIDDDNELDFTFTFSQRRSHFTNEKYIDIYGTENNFLRDYVSNIWNYKFTPQYTFKGDILDFGNEFLLGTELKYSLLDGKADEEYPDYGYKTHEIYCIDRMTGGIFAHDELWLIDELSLAVGARLERNWNKNNVASNGNRADNLAAGETALNYRPTDDIKIFLKWCSFYRNPFIDEYRWRDGSRSETSKPERGWDAEIGSTWNISEEWFTSIVAYYSETKNEIHYNPFAMSNENSPWLHRREGIDLACGWERDKVAGIRASWSGVCAEKAEGDYEGKWVPGVPRQQLNLEGRVWVWDEFSIFGGYRMIGARYAISDTPNANGRMSVDSIFRIGCQYKPTYRYLNGFTFGFTCENLFDRNYCDYAVASVTSGENAYYPAAGRSLMFTIRYEF